MITRVEGIIVASLDYRENDIITRVMTKEYGLISLVCKGAKKYTSKNRSSILTYCLSEFIFDYQELKTIFTLQKANFIRNLYIKEDLIVLSAMNFASDVLKILSREDSDYYSLYNDYLQVLELINQNRMYEALSVYLSKASKTLGIKPVVDSCAKCNEEKVVTLSNRDGGFLCQKHAGTYEVIEPSRLKKFRMINHMDFEHISYLDEYHFDLIDFDYMADFFLTHIDMELKSYRFLRSLLSL